jgi:hypothetical protein
MHRLTPRTPRGKLQMGRDRMPKTQDTESFPSLQVLHSTCPAGP